MAFVEFSFQGLDEDLHTDRLTGLSKLTEVSLRAAAGRHSDNSVVTSDRVRSQSMDGGRMVAAGCEAHELRVDVRARIGEINEVDVVEENTDQFYVYIDVETQHGRRSHAIIMSAVERNCLLQGLQNPRPGNELE